MVCFWCERRDLILVATTQSRALISALLRSSVSRGSDSHLGCHSTPLPFQSRFQSYTNTKDHLIGWSFGWCERRDLNPYGVNHTPLKRARLPVPPLSHIQFVAVPLRLRYYIKAILLCQHLFSVFSIFFKRNCRDKSRQFFIHCR